jgi:hypothetical protein
MFGRGEDEVLEGVREVHEYSAAMVSKLNQFNYEWCIASIITAASQMDDIKK